MKKRSTIADVAKLAQVSKTTVSKYLNQVPYVSAASQKKIAAAIEELQFSPSGIARGLVSKKTGLLGLVIGDFLNPANTTLVKAMENKALEHGYNMVLFSTNDEIRKENVMSGVLGDKYRHVDGVLLANVRKDGVALQKLENSFEHIVLAHRYIPNCSADYVVIDSFMGGQLAANYLLKLGHKRIGIITGPQDIYSFEERYRGFKDILQKNDLYNEDYVIIGKQYLEDGYRGGELLLSKKEPPTAIFAASDLLALGVLETAYSYKMPVPEALSVVGFDDIFFSEYAKRPLTTINGRLEEIACKAVEILIDKINGCSTGESRQVVLQPSLIVRESADVPHSAG